MGMWPLGWFGIDNTGTPYVCTVGGVPGTWAAVGTGGGGLTSWGDAATATFAGSGSPVGVVTPSGEGDLYIDDTTPALWQATGVANTDWVQVGTSGQTVVVTHDDYTASPGDYVIADSTEVTAGAPVIDPGGAASAVDAVDGAPASVDVTITGPFATAVVIGAAIDVAANWTTLEYDSNSLLPASSVQGTAVAIALGAATNTAQTSATAQVADTSGTATGSVVVSYSVDNTSTDNLGTFNTGSGTVTDGTIIDTGTWPGPNADLGIMGVDIICPTGVVTVSDSSDLDWTPIYDPIVISGTVTVQSFYAIVPKGFNGTDIVITVSKNCCATTWIGYVGLFSAITLPPATAGATVTVLDVDPNDAVVSVAPAGGDTIYGGWNGILSQNDGAGMTAADGTWYAVGLTLNT
jgi:hypothetical protein